jgi:hypothetical protein
VSYFAPHVLRYIRFTHQPLSCTNTENSTSSSGRPPEKRPHRGINLDVPVPTPTPIAAGLGPAGRIERVDVLSGLIHEYRRAA